MRLSFLPALVAVGAGVASAASIDPRQNRAGALPVSLFEATSAKPKPMSEILAVPADQPAAAPPRLLAGPAAGPAATTNCASPRVRIEWDDYSAADRQSFISAVRCLQRAPASGRYPQARNRYEDLVALHQAFTPNIHGNAKFLIWHRYYLWTFEDLLRTECGFRAPLPWFDERKWSGRFAQSSIFSSAWFGAVDISGSCVPNGQFSGVTLNVGPGQRNVAHCLSRNGNGGLTANTNAAAVNGCNARTTYSTMGSCAEGGAHAYGHNGIGSVMSDVFASPGDPVFWLHHAFIDRNYRIWQNADPSRIQTLDGTDVNGNPLTLNTDVSVNGVRRTVKIRDIINTLGTTLCYRYSY